MNNWNLRDEGSLLQDFHVSFIRKTAPAGKALIYPKVRWCWCGDICTRRSTKLMNFILCLLSAALVREALSTVKHTILVLSGKGLSIKTDCSAWWLMFMVSSWPFDGIHRRHLFQITDVLFMPATVFRLFAERSSAFLFFSPAVFFVVVTEQC